MTNIKIEVEDIILKGEIYDTPTGNQILSLLPIVNQFNVWGNELYFDIGIHLDQEPDAREELEVGDLAYWPVGKAFCIFYGTTPTSTDGKPRAYSAVNVFGRIIDDVSGLKHINPESDIKISKA